MGTRGYRRFEWLPGSLVARGIRGRWGPRPRRAARGHAAEGPGPKTNSRPKRRPKPDRPPAEPNKRVAVAQGKAAAPLANDLRRAMPKAADALADERQPPLPETKKDFAAAFYKNPRPPLAHGHARSTGLATAMLLRPR